MPAVGPASCLWPAISGCLLVIVISSSPGSGLGVLAAEGKLRRYRPAAPRFNVYACSITDRANARGCALPVIDCAACLVVARLFDRERLGTGRQH
jgi:hypothetical protein